MSKRVVIYGASGFIGHGLAERLAKKGYEVDGVSRKGAGNVKGVSRWSKPQNVDLGDCFAVIHLAGEPIDQRWTTNKKREFHASRVGISEEILAKINQLAPENRPKVWLNGSAVGLYPDAGDNTMDENTMRGTGYLAELCEEWEAAALPATSLGVRTILLRIGVVLGKEGRAFQKLLTVFRLGMGGRLGSGKQWMPWIHVDDLREAIIFCIENTDIQGPVNGSAPKPVTNSYLTRKLAEALGRWEFFPVPGFALKLVFGAFGGYLLTSQRVIPKVLIDAGYSFQYPTLEDALRDLIPNI